MNETKYQYCTATEASVWSDWRTCGVNTEIAELLKANEEVIIKPKNLGYDGKIYKYRVAPAPKYCMIITGPNGYNEKVILAGKPTIFAFEAYSQGNGWTEIRAHAPRLNEVYNMSVQEVYE